LLAFRGHTDFKIFLLNHGDISILDLLVHKILELFANNDPQAVNNILPGPFVQLFVLWEVVLDLRVLGRKEHHVFDAQRFVYWAADMLYGISFNDLNNGLGLDVISLPFSFQTPSRACGRW